MKVHLTLCYVSMRKRSDDYEQSLLLRKLIYMQYHHLRMHRTRCEKERKLYIMIHHRLIESICRSTINIR